MKLHAELLTQHPVAENRFLLLFKLDSMEHSASKNARDLGTEVQQSMEDGSFDLLSLMLAVGKGDPVWQALTELDQPDMLHHKHHPTPQDSLTASSSGKHAPGQCCHHHCDSRLQHGQSTRSNSAASAAIPANRNCKHGSSSTGATDDSSGTSSRGALRLVCKGIRDLSYPLITHISDIQLGESRDSNLLCKSIFNDDPAFWPRCQVSQQQAIKTFLEHLHRLCSAGFDVGPGGMSQLIHLVERRCFAARLMCLRIHSR